MNTDDFVKVVERLKKDGMHICLSPELWSNSKVPSSLTWTDVKFVLSERTNVPSVRGVYAFVISYQKSHFPPNYLIVYFGETGETGNETLRSRFVSYFRELKGPKRRAVHYALRKYASHIYFYFCAIPDRRRSVKKLEKQLTGTFFPVYNVRDFDAELRPAVAAF
jgi:hypothetical protein